MPNTKEVRNKIHSIQSTQKITRAMEMVAASKMRKAQQRMFASRPYLQAVMEVIDHVIRGKLEYTHPYLITKPLQKVIYIVVSSDRGLCGGLNTNLFKTVIADMKEQAAAGKEIMVATLGKRAETFFVHHHAKVIATVVDLGDKPRVKDLVGIMKVALDAYDANEAQQIKIAYNKFVSSLVQKPQLEIILPISRPKLATSRGNWDYIYEPDAAILLDLLLHRYLETVIYQGTVENVACEQAARMIAMRNASDNAEDIIDDLRLLYNKARQAAITKELAEIVAGAAAV